MNKIKIGLLIEGFTAVALATLLYFVVKENNSMYLFILPFDLLSDLLRGLSLSSNLGNVLAFIIYAIVSLLPLAYLLLIYQKKQVHKSDALLPVISLYSFYMLYHFINPALMLKRVPDPLANQDTLPVIKLAYAIILYTLFIVYFIFHILENVNYDRKKDRRGYLNQKLQKILIFAAALYTFLIGFFYPFNMFYDLNSYFSQHNSNASPDVLNTLQTINGLNNTDLNVIFILLKYILNIIPIVFSILILIHGIQLLKSMISHHLQDEEIGAASDLARISKTSVYVTVVCNLTLNIFQFLLSKQLSNTNFTLQISLLPLIIAFAAYILAGYFKESKDFYEDNNMFI
jgi:hypothetical protein